MRRAPFIYFTAEEISQAVNAVIDGSGDVTAEEVVRRLVQPPQIVRVTLDIDPNEFVNSLRYRDSSLAGFVRSVQDGASTLQLHSSNQYIYARKATLVSAEIVDKP